MDYKRENRIAEEWLIEYNERKRTLDIKLGELEYLKAAVSDGLPRSTDIGRPCENHAIELAEIKRGQRWILAVYDLEQDIDIRYQEILRLRREAETINKGIPGRHGWVEYVKTNYCLWLFRVTGEERDINKETIKLWWRQIIDMMVRKAIRNACF